MAMAIELCTATDYISVSFQLWRECLTLARTFGWMPAGTLHGIADRDLDKLDPETLKAVEAELAREWGGWYTSNDWQRVTDTDALALGLALGRAVVALETGPQLTSDQTAAARCIDFDPRPVKRIAEFI